MLSYREARTFMEIHELWFKKEKEYECFTNPYFFAKLGALPIPQRSNLADFLIL